VRHHVAALFAVALLSCCSAPAAAQATGAVAGRIIAPDGSAAKDVVVFVSRSAGADRARWIASTRSGFDGRYEMRDLPAGLLFIGVVTKGVTFYPGVTETAAAVPVTIREGVPTEGIDVWIAPARPYSIAGQVFDREGRELKNLSIEYTDPEGTRIWYVTHPLHEFVLESVATGPMILLARAESVDGPLIGLAATEVTRGPVDDVRIVLGRPATIEGRVTALRAIPAGVALRVRLAPTLIAPSFFFRTDPTPVAADGTFRITGLLGDYKVAVEGLPSRWTLTSVSIGGRRLAGDLLRLRSGDTISGLEIEIVPPAP
jgi:hypothetical protein